MTRLEKHTRILKDGTQRVYRYAVGTDGERHSLSEGTVSTACYRTTEKRRIVAALQANSSLLIVGEAGGGPSTGRRRRIPRRQTIHCNAIDAGDRRPPPRQPSVSDLR
jgi:hypothetical protein